MRALAVGFVQRQQEGETVEVTRFVYEDGDLFDASREDLLSANVQQGVDYTVIEDWPAVERLLSEDGEPEPEYFEEYDPRGHDDIQELDHTAPGSIALYPKKTRWPYHRATVTHTVGEPHGELVRWAGSSHGRHVPHACASFSPISPGPDQYSMVHG